MSKNILRLYREIRIISRKFDNMQNMDEVLDWITRFCWSKKIGIQYIPYMDPHDPSICYEWPRLIIFNENWHKIAEKPFMLSHEIGHILNGDTSHYHNHNCLHGVGEEEYLANVFAIKLLIQYCQENDIHFNNIYDFAKAFGIPSNVYYILEKYIDVNKCNIVDF
ncbi:ImmA/IrrE family metallo-endopeptidase [Lactobacillus bombicola]|uniref:ImmA/IrrE family metallo-endopeptidase n=2 Tax=Lactobacillus bombicola TaxID=1505723 RepID=A0A396SP45_9LACO|nr:ImmA/IrrE family metallo-endopeptidase [Lactobacillus bombicola]